MTILGWVYREVWYAFLPACGGNASVIVEDDPEAMHRVQRFPRRIGYSLLPLSCRKTRIFKPLYTVCFLGVGSDQTREA